MLMMMMVVTKVISIILHGIEKAYEWKVVQVKQKETEVIQKRQQLATEYKKPTFQNDNTIVTNRTENYRKKKENNGKEE